MPRTARQSIIRSKFGTCQRIRTLCTAEDRTMKGSRSGHTFRWLFTTPCLSRKLWGLFAMPQSALRLSICNGRLGW